MKEIQGRIKFLVIPITLDYDFARITAKNTLRIKFGENWKYICDVLPTSHIIGKLSEITEEQAAEFVEEDQKLDDEYFGDICGYVNYCSSQNNWHPLETAKESLISLLKANNVWIKEWKEESKIYPIVLSTQLIRNQYLEHEDLPDDLLLIKL